MIVWLFGSIQLLTEPVDNAQLLLVKPLIGVLVVVDAATKWPGTPQSPGWLEAVTPLPSLHRWRKTLVLLYLSSGLGLLITPFLLTSCVLGFVTLRLLKALSPFAGSGYERVLLYLFLGLGIVGLEDSLTGHRVLYRTGWATHLMKIQVATIYFFAGIGKHGSLWRNGTALKHLLANPFYARFPQLVAYLPSWALRIATWSTLTIEIAFPLVYFDETRYLMIFLVAAMHLGIEILMRVKLFGWIMLSQLPLFLSTEHARVISSIIYRQAHGP